MRIDFAYRRYGFVDALAGDEAGGEFLKKTEPGGEVFEAFLA